MNTLVMNFTLECKDVRFQLSIWNATRMTTGFCWKDTSEKPQYREKWLEHSGYEQMKFKHDKAMQKPPNSPNFED